MKHSYTVDTIIKPSAIGPGQRCLLEKSGSSASVKEGNILELMNIFLHQQQSTITHILGDIKRLKESCTLNNPNEAIYKIGVYKEDMVTIESLAWFDREIFDYFNALEGYSAKMDLDKGRSSGATHPVYIKISWSDREALLSLPDISGCRKDKIYN